MLPTLALLACLSLSSSAQTGSGQAGQDPAETAAEPRARATVLHLAGGTVLRTQAREVDGLWEVKQGKEWKRLPAGLVLRAAPERELLAEAEKLERSIPRGDLVRRVACADWLVSEGLYVEALKQIERVLDKAPDQPDALALLARADLPLSLPPVPATVEGLDPFFSRAAQLSSAAREVAVLSLDAAPEIPGLREALGAELLARTPARRAFATLALRRLFPGTEVEALLGRAILDPSENVRTSAALTLGAADNPAVIVPALRAVGSKHAIVRTHAIEALAAMDYREAVEPLYGHLVSLQSGGGAAGAPRVHIFNGRQTAYVQDFDVEVASGQSIADPIINVLTEGSVLDVAVLGVTEYVVQAERAAVRRALSSLTGADPGDTTAAWQRWWSEHGGEWTAGAGPLAPTSPAGRGR